MISGLWWDIYGAMILTIIAVNAQIELDLS